MPMNYSKLYISDGTKVEEIWSPCHCSWLLCHWFPSCWPWHFQHLQIDVRSLSSAGENLAKKLGPQCFSETWPLLKKLLNACSKQEVDQRLLNISTVMAERPDLISYMEECGKDIIHYAALNLLDSYKGFAGKAWLYNIRAEPFFLHSNHW